MGDAVDSYDARSLKETEKHAIDDRVFELVSAMEINKRLEVRKGLERRQAGKELDLRLLLQGQDGSVGSGDVAVTVGDALKFGADGVESHRQEGSEFGMIAREAQNAVETAEKVRALRAEDDHGWR